WPHSGAMRGVIETMTSATGGGSLGSLCNRREASPSRFGAGAGGRDPLNLVRLALERVPSVSFREFSTGTEVGWCPHPVFADESPLGTDTCCSSATLWQQPLAARGTGSPRSELPNCPAAEGQKYPSFCKLMTRVLGPASAGPFFRN